jgi:hypothetical protein
MLAAGLDLDGSCLRSEIGSGRPEPVGRLRSDALDALSCGQVLADHILVARWVTVAEALTQDAHAGAARAAAAAAAPADHVAGPS